VFLDSFKVAFSAVAQIFLLGAIGYFLVKRNIIGQEGLSSLGRLVVKVTLPLLILCQLIKDFSFSLYPYWWIFPLISIAITAVGIGAGVLCVGLFKGRSYKFEFLSLTGFQNSGYLPLALIGALLPAEKINTMFIYLFLFLTGFNLVMFSLGAYMLSFHKNRKFELGSLFSMPVIATIIGLLVVWLGWQRFIPQELLKPLRMAGDCTIPLAMLVVGGNIAQIRLDEIDLKAVVLVSLVKLVILPFLGLLLVGRLKAPELIGLLIIMQLAMPPATLLSVITAHYKKESPLISQGIFFGHIISIFTIPVFLSLYFAQAMLR
jgi:predicted permease